MALSLAQRYGLPDGGMGKAAHGREQPCESVFHISRWTTCSHSYWTVLMTGLAWAPL